MVYEDYFKNYSSYDYNPKINAKDLNNLITSVDGNYVNDFEYSLRKGKIKILRSSYLGWFGGNNSKEDINFTFKKYWEKVSGLLKDPNYEKTIKKRSGFYTDDNKEERIKDNRIFREEEQKLAAQEREKEQKLAAQEREKEQKLAAQEREKEQKLAAQERERKNNLIKTQNIPDIKSNYSSFFKILKNYKIINTDDYYLADLKNRKNWGEQEFMEFLVDEAKIYYNRQNNIFTDFINRYNTLSPEEKDRVKNLEKSLDGILKILKPLVNQFDPEVVRLNQELRDIEKTLPQKLKDYRIPIETLRKVNLREYETREKIEELKQKIIDVKQKIEEKKGDKNKIIAQKKSKLNIFLIKFKNEIVKYENRLKQIEKIREESLNNLSKTNVEKFFRLSELDAVRSLNEKQIRERNSLLKSLEFERILSEIKAREEERRRQEELLKQEIEEAEKVYQQEKIITDKKIKEAKKRKTIAEDAEEWKIEEITQIREKIKNLSSIVEKKKAELHIKDVEIEYRKKITDEKIRQNFEKRKLEGEIEKLNVQKNILQKITDAKNTYSEKTKREISARQLEIEKTLKLNLENIKQRESEILAKSAKIKLDVFSTVSDLKEQTAIKLEIEKNLQDLKDEIIRKQDVKNLLFETVERIENQEISEAEEYNSFLEKEIEFKKKLEKKNLTLAEYKEIMAEEKEDIIEKLEHLKSQKLKKIYQLRENAIEQQMKIILTEGADNLKNNLFSLKYEIENLEKEKEISERKEDFAKFQSDNFKRELKLREQEIELLKNIRLKVLQKERLTLRHEAQSAISDMIKSIEKTERDADVREKLDEMLDDVETKEINQKSKAALFSLIDKIENKEIHDAAKEKLDFILGKIETHDNIDESRKTLDKILDKIEDENIKKDVEEKLDEILDDVELEDYDFLDEEDDFDNFLSNVKKHISGEKKIEQFSKINEIFGEVKEEDSKLKMDENIEMKDFRRPNEEGEGSGETSFDEFNDYNFFIQNIEDPVLKEKTRTFLGNIDGFENEKEKMPKIKNAYKSAINSALWEDQLDTDYWDGNIILDENAKFIYEQKVNNVNTALVDYDLHIDPTDLKVREFLDIKLQETLTDKKKEINGYSYNGEKIISRNISKNFFFNYLKKPASCQRFIDDLKNVINRTAKSQIASESYFEGRAVKDCAMEFIGELREEQSSLIDAARDGAEMREALREANDMDRDIKNIKKNLPFKMRMKIFRRTLSWRFTKLLRLLWKHKGKVSAIVFTLIASGIGILLNQLGVIAVVHNLKKAARSVKKYADDVHEMGSRIIHNIQSIYRIPGKILGWSLIGVAFFLRVLYFVTRMSGTAGSAWVFGIFGTILEITVYFSGNVETINEKASEVLEEMGNAIENAGIRSQNYIRKNLPRWYFDKPAEERTILQHVEAAAANVTFKIAQGTQYTGKKVQDAGELMKTTLWYMQTFMIVSFSLLVLIFIRNYIL